MSCISKRVRYLDLNEVQKKLETEYIHTITFNFDKVYEFKRIVHCKDCMWSEMKSYAPPTSRYYCKNTTNYNSGDFYCAMGERKEDEIHKSK